MADKVNYRGFPKGMDNRRANYDVPKGALRDGFNVDVLSSGSVRRRRGIAQAIASAGAHSLFAEDNVRMVWATPTTLKLATPNLSVSTILTDSRLASPLSYVALHGEIYFSNEAINGKINALNVYEPWGITPPAIAPALAATSGTRFVQVTCAFVTASGEISGAPLGAVVSCGDAPVIQASAIPQSSDSRVVATRLYVTEIDGTMFFHHADVPAGTTSFTIRNELARGDKLVTQFMQPPPPGQLIRRFGGRIYIAAGSNMFKTQPLRYGLYDPEEDFLMEPERIRLLTSVEDGMFVSSDGTYFLTGLGTTDMQRRQVFPYRAIEGASYDFPESGDVMWLSERGFVRGSDGGAAKNLTEDRVAMTQYTRGAMGLVEYDGHKAMIAITQGGTASRLVAKDFVESQQVLASEAE
jgi:hypothetical protein